MKKVLYAIALTCSLTYAKLQITTFHSEFIQTVTNDQNKTLHYKGELFFKAPNLAKWIYRSPMPKEIYIKNYQVIIIDKALEQVFVKRLDSNFDFQKLLKSAKKITPKHYQAKYNDKLFNIFLKDGILRQIFYVDELGNKVQIDFLHPKQNLSIDNQVFQFRFNPSWDVIYEQ